LKPRAIICRFWRIGSDGDYLRLAATRCFSPQLNLSKEVGGVLGFAGRADCENDQRWRRSRDGTGMENRGSEKASDPEQKSAPRHRPEFQPSDGTPTLDAALIRPSGTFSQRYRIGRSVTHGLFVPPQSGRESRP